jgi:hypothetical protein
VRAFLALTAISSITAVVVVSSGTSSLRSPASICRSTHVYADGVHAGHFRGGIDPETDIMPGGRFRLQVGAYRDRGTGLTQKILWIVKSKYPAGGELVLRGRRLSRHKRRFTQRFQLAGQDDPSVVVFPSIVAPPAEGCWKFTLRSGELVGRLKVWVHGHG